MSTRATIAFISDYETFYVYRHCDGYPEQIMLDIETALNEANGRWSDPECGMLVSFFLGWFLDKQRRLPDYMMTTGWHGDESYQYYIEWNKADKKWVARVSTEIIDPDNTRSLKSVAHDLAIACRTGGAPEVEALLLEFAAKIA